MIEEITTDKFEEKVLEASVPVLVDFSAVWCGPCQALRPTLEQISKECAGRANICSIDIDECRDLAQKYKITAVPAMLLFKDGVECARLVGLQQKEAIENLLLK